MFSNRLERLQARHSRLWWDTPTDIIVPGPPIDRSTKRRNERRADVLIDELPGEVEECPGEPREREVWGRAIGSRVRRFAAECLSYSDAELEILEDEGYLDATREFVRRARDFDQSLDADDLHQALRNVWIMNGIQLLLGRAVATTPSVFAYSMLYPYTDNFLDHPDIPGSAKRAFNERLGRRLNGSTLVPRSARERDVYRLVELVEGEFARNAYPDVHSALRAIHRAQERSLGQHGRSRSPYEVDTLGISLQKGGASVLADGFLVAGELTPSEEDFLFGYGVFLQLLDDLQDVGDDLRAGHVTVFTHTAAAWPLDRIAVRLFRYMERVLDLSRDLGTARSPALRDLIGRSCTLLLLQSVALHRDLFTRRFVGDLEASSPFRFSYLRRRQGVVRKKLERIRKILSRRGLSPIDLLGPLTGRAERGGAAGSDRRREAWHRSEELASL